VYTEFQGGFETNRTAQIQKTGGMIMAKLPPEEKYMKEAIRQAKKAAALGDVPIGCVIEYQGKIIGRGYNRRMADKTALAHAEILAIRKACKAMGDWRLEGCTMYVTLEPCPMCAGAIVQARIPIVVIGSMNPKAGCAGSVLDLLHQDGLNHQVETKTGVLKEECSCMLSDFFKDLRLKKAAATLKTDIDAAP
jgi:tRNA(adenine34) deaminase